jgi:sRNA-binding protein
MHDSIDKLAELFPNCFFRENHLRRPLKIGIKDDIIARHPDLRPALIVSALSTYARCVPYWDTLKAGAPRIDLDGNVAGEVTIEDEQNAQRKIAKAARRAKAKEIEASKAAESPSPVGKPAEQPKPKTEAKRQPEVRTAAPQIAESPQPPADKPSARPTPAPATDGPPRLGLAGLKAAAQRRREAQLMNAG